MKVPVVANVAKLNDEVAQLNRRTLDAAGVFALDLLGSPGCGKTALLEETLRILRHDLRVGVIVGDLATQRDADRLARWTDQVVQINTGKGCHLDANQVRQAMTRLDLEQLDLLFVENVGNLICPAGLQLGPHLKVGMFSVADGDDKVAKHPYLVGEAALLLLNKVDLLPYVRFNLHTFRQDLRQLRPDLRLIETSIVESDLDDWLNWLQEQVATNRGTVAAGA